MRALDYIRGLRLAAVAMVLPLIVLAWAGEYTDHGAGPTPRLVSFSDKPCHGASALDKHASCPAQPVPSPTKAEQDRSAAYDVRANGKDCWSHAPDFPRNTCHFGAKHGKVNVVLVGNSHAGEWLPALQRIAKRKHWRITTELASTCAMSDVIQMFPDQADRTSCRSWVRHAAVRVKRDRPNLIVFANRMSLTASGHDLAGSVPVYAKGMKRVFRHWRGTPVVLLRDTPVPGGAGISVPACLAGHMKDPAACNGTRSSWIPLDPGVTAAKGVKNVHLVNLNNHICGRTVCPAVVGGVIPYFDGSHLSATYSRTLAPYLMPHLVKALRHGRA